MDISSFVRKYVAVATYFSHSFRLLGSLRSLLAFARTHPRLREQMVQFNWQRPFELVARCTQICKPPDSIERANWNDSAVEKLECSALSQLLNGARTYFERD